MIKLPRHFDEAADRLSSVPWSMQWSQ